MIFKIWFFSGFAIFLASLFFLLPLGMAFLATGFSMMVIGGVALV